MTRVLTVLAGLLAPVLMAEEQKSVVRFANSDMLPGSIGSLSSDRLVWESPLLAEPASFSLAKLIDLSVPSEQPAIAAKHEASVSLTNGDVLRGQLAGVSADTIDLDTWYAGRMRLNRLMVSKIAINERQSSIYRGPTGLEGWKQSADPPVWTYRNAGFRSLGRGGIARDVGLPNECSVAFDVEWRGHLGFKVVLFSNDIETDTPGEGYEFSFNPRSVSLRNCHTPRGIGNTLNVEALQENEKVRVEIRASLSSGKVCLLIDGRPVENWTDPDAPAAAELAKAGGVHFISQQHNGLPLQISRIEIGSWDGNVEPVAEVQRGRPWNAFEQGDDSDVPPAPKPEAKPDRMELRNGDNLSGEVLAVDGGMISIKTPFRDVKLPIEALRGVALKPAEIERCKRENGDVRGWFPDGSSVVFRLDNVAEGSLTGTSQNFGKATFKLPAFNRIEFNIYEPEFEEIRAKNVW